MNEIGAVIAAVVGLLLGGLLNILVVRLPRERRLSGWPNCTRCGRPLSWGQIVPVIGWLQQRGKARCCGKPLHWIHPAVELSTAVSVVLLFVRYGLSPQLFYLAFVCAILILTGAIDWLHRWIYTITMLGGTAIVLAAASFVRPHNLINAGLGLLAAGLIFIVFYLLARVLFPAHRAPFGLGDVYLAMFIGASMGVTRLAPTLFSGMLLAGVFSVIILLLRAAGRAVPPYISYGTFLCVGAVGYILVRGL